MLPTSDLAPLSDTDRLAFWLGQVALGDKKAFALLYRATAPYLMGVAILMVKRRERAEDVLQDAFVNVWRSAGLYAQTSASPMSWLISIVRNKSLDHLRAGKRGDEQHFMDDEPEISSEEMGGVTDPLELLSIAGQAHGVRQCLETLEAPVRQALAIAYYEGNTQDQVSRQLSVPLGTVKTWIRRGLLHLRHCLEAA